MVRCGAVPGGLRGKPFSDTSPPILAVRGSVRAAAAAASSVDAALSVAMRAAGAAGLCGETLSMLGIGSLFGLVYAIKGGFALPSEQSLPLAAHVPYCSCRASRWARPQRRS